MGDSYPPDHGPVDAAQSRLERRQHVHIVGTHTAILQEMVNGQWVDVRWLKIRKEEDGKYVVSLSEEVE